MRVLHISKFFPPVMGGIEKVAWELCERLHRAGMRPGVLCSSQRIKGAREHAEARYEVRRAGRWGTALSTSIAPTMPLHLSRLSRHADIVHVHMPDPMAAASLWCVRPRTKLVVHWHSDVVRQRRAMKAYEPLQRWVLSRADAIIATSESYAEASAPLRPWRHKVKVIPIGISDISSAVSVRKVSEIRRRHAGKRVIFSIGRMTYYKGFDVLIEAAVHLPGDCVVLIGGEGNLLDQHKRLIARRGLTGKVHMLGHVHGHELASHFAACDIFCLSSTARSEAYGVAMLEAMAMGKPVVASDIAGSGVPWVNQHGSTGLNVPAGQSAALAQALRTLLDDEDLRQRLGEAARRRYELEFGAERMTERTIDLYRQLLPAFVRHEARTVGTDTQRAYS